MADIDETRAASGARLLSRQSAAEASARPELVATLAESPIPSAELGQNLSLYLGRLPLTDLLAMDHVYRMILDVLRSVMEFGVRWGRHLGAFTALRGVYEPNNVHRRIVGIDSIDGSPDVSGFDVGSHHTVAGGLPVTAGYRDHLERVLAAHEAESPLGHIQRTLCVAGDVRDTVPGYLSENPQMVIALAYFDLDLYEPTKAVLECIEPYLCVGSVLAFDEVGHAKWPGETKALREVLGTRGRAGSG